LFKVTLPWARLIRWIWAKLNRVNNNSPKATNKVWYKALDFMAGS
jgi:hypothetical protein